MPRGQDDGSWSRAYMAGSGLSLSRREVRESPERHIAEGADLSRERMLELAHHRDSGVREALARREDCPFGVLASLAHDSKVAVRGAVACHPRAGVTLLEHLAGDRDAFVVKAVVRNPVTPAGLLASLSRHRREEVRHLAAKVQAERAGVGDTAQEQTVPWLRQAASTSLHPRTDSDPQPSAQPSPQRRHTPTVLPPRPIAGATARIGPEATVAPVPAQRHFLPGVP